MLTAIGLTLINIANGYSNQLQIPFPLTIQVPGQGRCPTLQARGCDNVAGRGYRTSQGSVMGGYGAMVEWWLSRETRRDLKENPALYTHTVTMSTTDLKRGCTTPGARRSDRPSHNTAIRKNFCTVHGSTLERMHQEGSGQFAVVTTASVTTTRPTY
jgi:hypothetical protein